MINNILAAQIDVRIKLNQINLQPGDDYMVIWLHDRS